MHYDRDEAFTVTQPLTLVRLIRARPNDAPMPTEFLLDKAADSIEDLIASLTEMVEIYWGEGDGENPPPACIVRAQRVIRTVER